MNVRTSCPRPSVLHPKSEFAIGESHELKAIETLIARAKQLIQDALTVADAAGDVAVVRKIKPLLARVSDVEADIEGHIKAAGQGQS